jgi:hypothetical protein
MRYFPPLPLPTSSTNRIWLFRAGCYDVYILPLEIQIPIKIFIQLVSNCVFSTFSSYAMTCSIYLSMVRSCRVFCSIDYKIGPAKKTPSAIGHDDSVGLSVCEVLIFDTKWPIHCWLSEKEGNSKGALSDAMKMFTFGLHF